MFGGGVDPGAGEDVLPMGGGLPVFRHGFLLPVCDFFLSTYQLRSYSEGEAAVTYQP